MESEKKKRINWHEIIQELRTPRPEAAHDNGLKAYANKIPSHLSSFIKPNKIKKKKNKFHFMPRFAQLLQTRNRFYASVLAKNTFNLINIEKLT
jgi:hypothetical protein